MSNFDLSVLMIAGAIITKGVGGWYVTHQTPSNPLVFLPDQEPLWYVAQHVVAQRMTVWIWREHWERRA